MNFRVKIGKSFSFFMGTISVNFDYHKSENFDFYNDDVLIFAYFFIW